MNRPLLEQLAENSGGLAAFISPGDNFTRQARAFRQKLMRPFATNLEIKFAGVIGVLVLWLGFNPGLSPRPSVGTTQPVPGG